MSNYTTLKTTINANIRQNGNQEITGKILNSVLNAMVNTLGEGYQFAGIATTETDPGTPDAKVFYIANGKGEYTHFWTLEVTEDEVVFLVWDKAWHKVATGIAADAKLKEAVTELTEIAGRVENKQDIIPDLEAIREGAGKGNEASSTIASIVEAGYVFAGIATPETNPGTPDTKVFYIAKGNGTYTSFSGIEVTEDEVVALCWDSLWNKVSTGIASDQKLSELEDDVKAIEHKTGTHITGTFAKYTKVADVDIPIGTTFKNNGGEKLSLSSDSTRDGATKTLDYNEIWVSTYVIKSIWCETNVLEGNVDANIVGSLDFTKDINGLDDVLVAEMDSASHTNYTYVPNTLALGDKYKAVLNVTHAQWTMIGFSKDTSSTFGSEGVKPILEKNTISEYVSEGIAPDPLEYPYIYYQKNGVGNTSTAKLYKMQKVEGLNEKVDTLQKILLIRGEQTKLLNGGGIYVSSDTYKQNSAWKTLYFFAEKGKTYNLQLSTTTKGIQIATCSQEPTAGVRVNSLYGDTKTTYLSVSIDVKDYTIIAISYGVSGELTANITTLIAKTDDIKVKALPIYGGKVLMLGDSITQLPLNSESGGKGIAEYFADLTGAETIRGGFGGSHLRARRIVNSVDDIDLNDSSVEMQEYAKATLDLPYITKALCEQDFSLQDKAMEWYRINRSTDGEVDNNWTYWRDTIEKFKALNISTLSAITILIGTNDYSNNVPLGEANSTDINRAENGAWNYVLEKWSTAYPTLPIFIFTPIVRMSSTGEWIPDTPNSAGITLRQYAETTIDAAKRFYLPVCDLMLELGWNKYNFWSFFNSADGTHPRKGFRHIAAKMASFITSHWNRY